MIKVNIAAPDRVTRIGGLSGYTLAGLDAGRTLNACSVHRPALRYIRGCDRSARAFIPEFLIFNHRTMLSGLVVLNLLAFDNEGAGASRLESPKIAGEPQAFAGKPCRRRRY